MSKLIYVPGEKSWGADGPDVIFVGEAPGETEEREQRPFVGKSGQFLRETLLLLGIEDYYLTNAVKVRPEGNRKPSKEEIESWSPLLNEELVKIYDYYSPIIIALGSSADWAMKCVDYSPTYHHIWHPSYVLRFNKKKEWLKELKFILKIAD
jgi:DNA polymerase